MNYKSQRKRTAWLLAQMLTYACCPKEKVAASAVRALGYFLSKVDFNSIDEILLSINANE
jgi:hypothetical protein